MIHPESPKKLLWDLIVVLVTVTLALEVPYRIAFNPQVSGWRIVFDIVVSFIYAADIGVKFFTARQIRGKLESDKKIVARKYLRGSFVVDFVSTIPFDLIFLALPGASAGAVVAARTLRLARLLRIDLFAAHIQHWELISALNASVVRVVFFVLFVLLISHWVACGWIFLGAVSDDARFGSAYLEGLYWAVTTLTTVGYGDVTPSTSTQVIYTMSIMFLGVGVYAYAIGSIARLLVERDRARIEHKERVERVNTFMRYHQIDPDVQARVRRYYNYLWQSRHGIDERKLVSDLPDSLYVDVLSHLPKKLLMSVSAFRNAPLQTLRSLVRHLRPCVFGPGDYIVRQGEAGDEMFFLEHGHVEVLDEDEQRIAVLGPGDYFGEVALLRAGVRQRSIRALEFCDLYSLDRANFQATLQHFPEFAKEVERIIGEREVQQGDGEAGKRASV